MFDENYDMPSVEQVEKGIADARSDIEMGDILERLYKNADFKKIILEGYLEEEALNMVRTRALVESSEDQSRHVLAEIDAISRLGRHLEIIQQKARQAREIRIPQHEQLLAEIREGEGIE